jgi:hypothetical protein
MVSLTLLNTGRCMSPAEDGHTSLQAICCRSHRRIVHPARGACGARLQQHCIPLVTMARWITGFAQLLPAQCRRSSQHAAAAWSHAVSTAACDACPSLAV